MMRRIVELHQPVAEVAAGFGLSPRSAYKWLARFRAEEPDGLRHRSSRPNGFPPHTTHPLRIARVLPLRRRQLPAFPIARLTRLSKATVSRFLPTPTPPNAPTPSRSSSITTTGIVLTTHSIYTLQFLASPSTRTTS